MECHPCHHQYPGPKRQDYHLGEMRRHYHGELKKRLVGEIDKTMTGEPTDRIEQAIANA